VSEMVLTPVLGRVSHTTRTVVRRSCGYGERLGSLP
jgi:hypothetical protein